MAKLSITIEEADLKWVRAEAKRLGKSVSAVVSDAVAQKRALRVLARIAARQLPVTIPAVVVAEWYRGQRDRRRVLALAKAVEPTTEPVARVAGAALKATAGSNAIDAIVMASAAQRGDVVYTSHVRDLEALARAFPEVRILGA